MSDVVDGNLSEAPGRRLAAARQAQSLAPMDVARQLKLSVWQVDALENGNYAQLPGPVFVRGFIRNYARLVRLDPNELLCAAAAALPQDAPRPNALSSHDIPFPTNERPRWPLFGAAAAALVAVLVAYEFYWNDLEPSAAPVSTVATRPGKADAVPPPAQVAKIQPAAVSDVPDQPGNAETVAAAPQAINDASAPATSQPEVQPDVQRPLQRGERRVSLAFEQESWVEIRDRNERVIFSQLNRPGTLQLVQGVPPFSVVVGNAQGVRLTYEDKQINLAPHTKIDVARLILE